MELDYITEEGSEMRDFWVLQEHRLVPGTKVRVLDVAPSMGVMSLKVGQDEFSLGIEAARRFASIK